MPYVIKDRVKSTTTTTGTGTYTVGAAAVGFQAFSVIGDGNQTYYCCTNGTDWELGLGTYTSSGTTLSRDQILSSSNSGSAVNWGAGSKTVFVPLPADATQGTIPTADNSSIGTDLYVWENLKKTLNASVKGGVAFGNNGTNGQVSTYSLAYTRSGMYTGGVLASNGDIHFVATNALVGQKISIAGVVSTYSLIVASGLNEYSGGVLAPNGDIHFITRGASVGQKISAAGVVSTYSLVYTGPETNRYNGGVLAPNGDIHFVPTGATRGQKISAAGVVSTYSLVYTTSGAYFGGVLAHNGVIRYKMNIPIRR